MVLMHTNTIQVWSPYLDHPIKYLVINYEIFFSVKLKFTFLQYIFYVLKFSLYRNLAEGSHITASV